MLITHSSGLSLGCHYLWFRCKWEEIFEQLKASPFFTLMVDETTDVVVVKEVITYAHYLDQKRKVQASFIAMKEAVDGRADTIMAV